MVDDAGGRFGVLGPLEVHVGDRMIHVKSPKQRILLARLLLDSGQPVSTTALSQAIWGNNQPANPRRAVQVCVARLRSELASLGPLIVTCADGYAIQVGSDRTDLGRFQAWIRVAQEGRARADLEREATSLAAALGQWRGEPLADVPSELLHDQVVPRLWEQWLQTLESRIECDLRRGRHDELVGELREATARYPLRYRLWAQLIRALDGSGCRTEALEVYHRVRNRLVEELGVEPDEELRHLHASLLVGRTGESRAPEAAIPRQLPPNVYGFVGRHQEMAYVDTLMASHQDESAASPRIAIVSGAAGVGKTTLVAHWARQVTDHFPDGQLWVDLRGYDPEQALPPARVLTRFLRALGVQGERIPQNIEDQCALYRSLLDGRRVLVVLDNANATEQVRPLLPGGPGCRVVVTSRSQLADLVAVEGAALIDLDLFNVDEARQLLGRRAGMDRVAAQPHAVDELIHRCAGLPLALAIVGARAASQPQLTLETLATELNATRGALDAFRTGTAGTEIRAVFSWSLGNLRAESARLFRLLGLHPGPDVAVPAAASLAGVEPGHVRSLLTELTSTHLLTEHEPGRYSLHDLLRAYATELISATESDTDRQAAEQRMLDHHLHTAAAAARQFYPAGRSVPLGAPATGTTPEASGDSDRALDWFTHELAALLDLVNYGSDTHTWRLTIVLVPYLIRRGYWQELEGAARAAVASAERLDDPSAQGRSHRILARAYMRYPTYIVSGGAQNALRSRRLEAAEEHLRQAIDLGTLSRDPSGLGDAYLALCFLREEQGRDLEALETARHALDAYISADDERWQAIATSALGWHHAKVGDHEQALTLCEQALTWLEQLNDLEDWSDTCDNLGYIHHKLGNHKTAAEWYSRAIEHYRAVGHRSLEASSTIGLGDTLHAADDISAAGVAWHRALEILTDLNHPDAERLAAKLAVRSDTSNLARYNTQQAG